jgi:hypothetical protein
LGDLSLKNGHFMWWSMVKSSPSWSCNLWDCICLKHLRNHPAQEARWIWSQ